MIGGSELTIMMIILFLVTLLPFLIALIARVIWRRENRKREER